MVNLPAKEAARTIVDLKKNCTPDIRRMGCPGGTRSVFTRAFRAKRELRCIFLEKKVCLLYTSPSPRDATLSRMPSSA